MFFTCAEVHILGGTPVPNMFGVTLTTIVVSPESNWGDVIW